MSEELDPSIMAILDEANAMDGPDNVIEEVNIPINIAAPERIEDNDINRDPYKVDLSIRSFKKIEKEFDDVSSHAFDDPTYYKTAMSGEGQAAQRLHQLLSKYLTCKDVKDRSIYRQQIINVYWEMLRSVVQKISNPSLPLAKKMMLRFAVVLPSLFTAEQKEFFSKVFIDNNSGEPVFYLDEWFKGIATGKIGLSTTDDLPQKKSSQTSSGGTEEQQRLLQLENKNSGKLQTSENQLNAKESERSMVESELKSRIDQLCEHSPYVGLEPYKMPLSDSQKKIFAEINERLKALQKIDKELVKYLAEYQEAKDIQVSLEGKMGGMPSQIEINTSEIMQELDTVRQMAKMTVGRKGNHFPIYTREFYHCMPNTTGFRENVIKILDWIESIDPNAFVREHKNQRNRIVPFTILIPTYGDMGMCWEPFNRYNRLTSRGRIAVPMYPRDLKIAVLAAVADLRWQVAKEKASFDWMNVGCLTGNYYQWIESQKIRGDLKTYFIADYILWMTKEANGIQKLPKEVRQIFWRYMPFPQERKDELGKRSPVYQELIQRDKNRDMSDGY